MTQVSRGRETYPADPTHTWPLAGRCAIVTGASRGLGRRIAETFWQAGASLLLAARSGPDLSLLCDQLRTNESVPGQNVSFHACDLSEPDAAGRIARAAHDVWGRIDVLVNNAGILGPIGPAWENDWVEWTQTMQVNLLATVRLCRECVPGMVERGYGKVINLSGGGAAGPRPNFSAYAAAKAAVVRFSETLAHELHTHHVDVNCVAPGALNTAMSAAVVEAGARAAGENEYGAALRLSQQTTASEQHAADLCVFLASAKSDGITGRLISAVWDPWQRLPEYAAALEQSDVYTLRRIVPADRGLEWHA